MVQSKLTKEGQTTSSALSKLSSQIRKPPRRKTSPINWFPRKKVDSYLNRKIKMLQVKSYTVYILYLSVLSKLLLNSRGDYVFDFSFSGSRWNEFDT